MNSDRHKQYKEYRLNTFLMSKESRIVYTIVSRNHKERTLLIEEYVQELQSVKPDNRLYVQRVKARMWKHVKELRKHFMLLDKKVMQVLYGE